MSYPMECETYRLCWQREATAYRDAGNGVDATNLVGNTFFTMPLRVTQRTEFGRLWQKQDDWIPGLGADYGYAAQKSYIQPTLTLSGPFYNMNMLYLMMGGCVSTETTDTVASGQGTSVITLTNATTYTANELAGATFTLNALSYSVVSHPATNASALVLTIDRNCGGSDNGKTLTFTAWAHQYATNYVPSRPANPPSFQLWEEFLDGNGSTIKLYLHTGCVIQKTVLSGVVGSDDITCTLTITYSNTVAGTMLTNVPSPLISSHNHHMDGVNTTITDNYNAGGAAKIYWKSNDVVGNQITVFKRFEIIINNNSYTDKAAGETVPVRRYWGNRQIEVTVEVNPTTFGDFTADEIDPSLQDWTFDFVFYRSPTDQLNMNFAHFWNVAYEYGTFRFNNRILQRAKTYHPNPYKTPITKITQIDTNADVGNKMFAG